MCISAERSETFRFQQPMGERSETSRFHAHNILLYYRLKEAINVSLPTANGQKKRNISLPFPQSAENRLIYYGRGEMFRCLLKRDVSLLIAISCRSEVFHFRAHNNGTHHSLQKTHYVRRNFFAYYANC